jgi:hypothetical protein
MTVPSHPNESSKEKENPRLALDLLCGLSGAVLLLHIGLSGRYGYFRDELYFLDCGRHLAWGYVDMAPGIAFIARLALMLGGSLHVLRIIAGFAGAGIVAITMLIAWRLGGGRFAQGFAGLCAALAPMYLATASLMTMNVFEVCYWSAAVYVVIRIVQTGNSRLWVWFGVISGIGLMNKHSTLFFGFAVLVGVLLTDLRRELLKPWIWIGGAIAVLIFLPNIAWQIEHHFPTLEDLNNVKTSGKNVILPPGKFVFQQIMMLHPVISLVWVAGLWYFLIGKGRRYRVVAWIYLTLLVIFIALHGKDYYLGPAYPMLFAGGAIAIAGWVEGKRWLRAAVIAVVVLAGLHALPAVTPILSPENQVVYRRFMRIDDDKTEVNHSGPLPQMFGDQFGWPELTAEVAAFYNSLPADERSQTAILTGNYGEAGAIDMFGPKYGLPTALSGHQNHYYWGTMGFAGRNLVTIQYGPRYLGEICTSVDKVEDHYHPWGMGEENRPVYFCRGLKKPLADLWEDQKHWN